MKWQLILVTPEMAAKWLERMAPNRKVRPALVRKYAMVMANGDWLLTHQGLAFDVEEYLLDGQHRLLAIIMINLPVWLWVCFGAERGGMQEMDTGQRRRPGERLTIAGCPNANAVAATAKAMLAGLKYRPSVVPDSYVFKCVDKYGAEIEYIIGVTAKRRLPAAALAVLVKATIFHGTGSMDSFCESIRSNVFPEAYSPANQLTQWLTRPNRKGTSYLEVYGKTVTAVRAHLEGRRIKYLAASKTDICLGDMLATFGVVLPEQGISIPEEPGARQNPGRRGWNESRGATG